ncbi:DUF4126 domain-containing protein [soil metagenome]
MTPLDIALSLALGIGLAAATGFRLFLPLLITSIATYSGYIPVSDGFAWLASPAAILMLGAASIVEIVAFYIPGLDNLLDTLAGPAALVAGTLVSAAVMGDLPPLVKWTAAIIAGGGAAGLTQGVTTALRAGSTAFTGGLGNFVVATAEILGATGIAILAIAAPFIAVLLVVLFCIYAVRTVRRFAKRKSPAGQ